MRKQTKLVAVLSAAALLAVGASMTSFAAGWTEENGTWVYYDSDDELVTNEWKKSGSNYYYLNDDGEMATETWVDDEYYVDETGKMVTNQWLKLVLEDADIDDPDGDGEGWFWFDSKGKKVTDMKKTINGKVYYFDDDGVMEYGWYEDENNNIYYLGDEDDGARKSGWLWLEKPDEESDDVNLCDDEDCTNCDEEGWYWFAKDGKVYKDEKQKKIDGKYYYFNDHGQMLYNWIIASNSVNIKDSEDVVDAASGKTSNIDDMEYAFNVDKGWRVNGWLKVDGSYNTNMENEEDWYFFDKGEAEYAIPTATGSNVGRILRNEGYLDVAVPGVSTRYRAKVKVEGKWFCFDQNGRMKTGLQAIGTSNTTYDVYYFDGDGNMKTGKVSNVELNNGETANFYFETNNSHKGRGVTGEENGYLYYKGMRLEAEDDYEFFALPNNSTTSSDPYDYYLVNTNGKIQKGTGNNGKKFDPEKIENDDYGIITLIEQDPTFNANGKDIDDYNVYVKTGNTGKIDWVRATVNGGTAIVLTNSVKDASTARAEDRFVSLASDREDVDFGWED